MTGCNLGAKLPIIPPSIVAMTGLRKNFSQSKPSYGASLIAPPMATDSPDANPIRDPRSTGFMVYYLRVYNILVFHALIEV